MRNRKWLWCLLVLPVILVVWSVWFVRGLVDRYRSYGPVARTLPAELDAAKREGLPLTAADLRPKPPVPDSQNAAPLYVRIDLRLRGLPKREQDDDKNVMDLLK